MKKNKYLKTTLIIPIILIGLILISFNNEKYFEQTTKRNNTLAIYVEDESGEYKLSSDQTFPTTGYVLNTEKSSCQNGGVLSQDESTKEISLSTAVADGCNVYFKKEEKPVIVDASFDIMGDYIIIKSITLKENEEIAHTYVRIEGDPDFYEPYEDNPSYLGMCAPNKPSKLEVYVVNTKGVASDIFETISPYYTDDFGQVCIPDPYVPLDPDIPE